MNSYLRKFKFPICPVIFNVLGSNVCSGVQWYVCMSWSKDLKFRNGQWINCTENEIAQARGIVGRRADQWKQTAPVCVWRCSPSQSSVIQRSREAWWRPVCVCAYFEFSCNEVFLRTRAVSEHIPNRTPNLRLLRANHINSYSTVETSGTFWLDSNESIQWWI